MKCNPDSHEAQTAAATADTSGPQHEPSCLSPSSAPFTLVTENPQSQPPVQVGQTPSAVRTLILTALLAHMCMHARAHTNADTGSWAPSWALPLPSGLLGPKVRPGVPLHPTPECPWHTTQQSQQAQQKESKPQFPKPWPVLGG